MTIFNDLTNALAPYVGGATAAGAIIGASFIFLMFAAFVFMFGRDVLNKQTGTILMLVVVSFASAPGVDWFPLWVPFLIVLTLAFMYWQKYL